MEELINSLLELIKAKNIHDIEREKCQYDWSYFGYNEIESLENASKDFEDALNKIIDERINERIQYGTEKI